MPDFQTQPATTDTYVNILTYLRDKEVALAKMDYTGWTNIPTGAIRSNTASSYKLERWNGSAWVALDFHTTIDSHIANTAIHQAINVGSIEMIAYGTADSGWVLCRGQSYPTATYPALFAKIGYTYGGSGANFNVPNLLGKIPIGTYPSAEAGYTATFAPINALGLTTGSFSHTHSTPAHSHAVNDHSHTMQSHTHSIGGHSHTINDHAHTIPAHAHNTQASGATISITASGTHSHSEDDLWTTSTGASGNPTTSITWRSSDTGATTTKTIDSTGSEHTHPNANITGWVGNAAGGISGDVAFNSGGSGTLTTNASTAYTSGGPSVADTSTATGVTTTSGGSGTSGTANPPVLTFNFQIKV